MMKLCLQYVFTELCVERLSLGLHEYNPRALRSYEKCGFRLEGRTRKDVLREGRRTDTFWMGILREEWLQMQNGGQQMKDIFTGKLVRLSAFDPEEMSKAFARWNLNSEYRAPAEFICAPDAVCEKRMPSGWKRKSERCRLPVITSASARWLKTS